MSLNKVMLIGNVGRDPEVRYLDGNSANGPGAKVATFTLATSERYRDRNGETRENTEWHNIVAWRNSADVAEKFIHKGTQVYIEGKLRTRSYNDATGNKKYTTEVVVDNLQLLGRRPDEDGGYQPRPVPVSSTEEAASMAELSSTVLLHSSQHTSSHSTASRLLQSRKPPRHSLSRLQIWNLIPATTCRSSIQTDGTHPPLTKRFFTVA